MRERWREIERKTERAIERDREKERERERGGGEREFVCVCLHGFKHTISIHST